MDRFMPSDKGIQRLYWLLVAAWLLVLYFQVVGPDEIEHAHVAWLMGEHGLRPFKDFFQHHMPLLWNVLKLYFQLGGSGPEVLYFGRGVVVLCAILTLWGFYLIDVIGSKARSSLLPPAMGGTAYFIAATLMLPALFNIRPETIAIALFIWSYLFWAASWRKELPRALPGILFSGVLLGFTFLASPRLVLLGGLFLLPTQVDHRVLVIDPKRLALLGAGALAAISGYLALSDTTLEEVHFILSFSTLLQQIGSGQFPDSIQVRFAILAVIALCGLLLQLHFENKKRHLHSWIDLAYLWLVILLSVLISGKYIYNQDVSPILVLIALLFVRGQKRLAPAPELRILFFTTTMALWGLLLSFNAGLLYSEKSVVGQVDKTQHQLTKIPPGESVMLSPGQHPIVVRYASFYGSPLTDSPDRLCRAVRRAQSDWPLLECDFLADLKRSRPFLVTRVIQALGSGAQLAEIRAFLDRHYLKRSDYYLRLPDGWANGDSEDGSMEFTDY